ncbi:MAG: hypothetical protein AAFP76_00080 [Bacteroidota bacterium]
MIWTLIKIVLMGTLGIIGVQDLKERQVWAFLFPLFGVLGAVLFYPKVTPAFFWLSIVINLGLVIVILLINFIVARYILKKNLFKEAMGLGDVLFFMGFAISFPTLTFINLFVFSILFTLVFHYVLTFLNRSVLATIPLAGCMSLFLTTIYLIHWTGFYDPLYFL